MLMSSVIFIIVGINLIYFSYREEREREKEHIIFSVSYRI